MKPAKKTQPALPRSDTLPPGLEASPAFRREFVANWIKLAALAVKRRATHADAKPDLVAKAVELLEEALRQHAREEWALLAFTMYALGRTAEALKIDVLIAKGGKLERDGVKRGKAGAVAVAAAMEARKAPIQYVYRMLRRDGMNDRQAVNEIMLKEKVRVGDLTRKTVRKYTNEVRSEFD